jgi:hypothetical protein
VTVPTTGTLLAPFVASRVDGFDALRLVRLAFATEIRLHLVDDEIVLRASRPVRQESNDHIPSDGPGPAEQTRSTESPK